MTADMKKTGLFVLAAAVLAGLAWLTTPRPADPELFSDLGQRFFPDLTDPLAAAAIEITTYDEAQAVTRPFKVQREKGIWTLPSHHGYPAEAKDRLKKVAAALIDLHKDSVASDRVDDHEDLGVIDPLDDKAKSLKGRGTRVTLKDEGGKVLADLVLGKPVKGRGGDDIRYVRAPGQRRAYTAKVQGEFSSSFWDWIEPDLLKVDRASVNRIRIDSYRIDRDEGTIKDRQQIVLKKNADWDMEGLASQEALDAGKVQGMLGALAQLRIVDVRPKPPGLSRDLKAAGQLKLTQVDLLSLASAGFYMTKDGELVSNEGEVDVQTEDGVVYTLRFGDVVAGEEVVIPMKAEEKRESRYLFVTARFDAAMAPEPAYEPVDPKAEEKARQEIENRNEDKKKAWQERLEKGKKQAQELSARFAGWYYVIPAEAYQALRLTRAELVKAKEKP